MCVCTLIPARVFENYQNLKRETWRRYGLVATLGAAPSPLVRHSATATGSNNTNNTNNNNSNSNNNSSSSSDASPESAGSASPKSRQGKWEMRRPTQTAATSTRSLSESAPAIALAPPIPPKPRVNIHTLRKLSGMLSVSQHCLFVTHTQKFACIFSGHSFRRLAHVPGRRGCAC